MLSAFTAPAILTVGSLLTPAIFAQQPPGPYKIIQTARVGGAGGFDYVYADSIARRLYIPRSGKTPRITVFNLDTLSPVGEIPGSAHGVAIAAGHGFASSKPVIMFDAKTLQTIKTIEVDGGPDGIFADPFNDRVYILSHRAPNLTAIDAKDGSVAGTLDLGGAPEQAVSDNNGHLYIDLEDKAAIAIVDAKTLKLTATYSLAGKGDGCAGLAIDTKHDILFAACREPQIMVILKAADGKILGTQPLGKGTDGAAFYPATLEAFSSQGDGTLTIVKESSPTNFAVEQTVATPLHAKTLTLDPRTGHILLIAADFTSPPAPAPGARPTRGEVIPETFSIVVVGK